MKSQCGSGRFCGLLFNVYVRRCCYLFVVIFGRENRVSCPDLRFRTVCSDRGIMFEILGVLFEVGMVRMRETFFVFPGYVTDKKFENN